MKIINLNESIQDLLGGDLSSQTPEISSMFIGHKKKKRPSLIEEVSVQPPATNVVQQTLSQMPQQIIIPQPLQEIETNQFIEASKANHVKKNVEVKSKQRSKVKEKVFTPEKNQEVKQDLEVITGQQLPEDINLIEAEEAIDTALQAIPGGNDIDLIDIKITSTAKKDKTGYFKSKVSLKSEKIPVQINKIATYIKTQTKGLIAPRVCDLRVIANTNKTQLRNSTLKLSATTIVFKPDFTKLKVNKGTRFMISVPENYSTTGNLIIYIQESRDKKILEISQKDFPSEQVFNEFIGDRVAEYYFSGYNVVIKKLELKGVNNPLMDLVNTILAYGEYKIKPHSDESSHIFAVDFVSKGTNNQWLIINVIESEIPGRYDVFAHNTANRGWEFQVSSKVTLQQLHKNFHHLLETCYTRDWSKELEIESEDDNFYYLFDKLVHGKLKKALIEIHDMKDEINAEIKTVLSKRDLAKKIDSGYDAEAILGKTDFLDYFIITYLAYQIVGGDKRKGREYITREQYYEKYNVKDKRNYQQRDNTILKKQEVERNYNSRPYIFQVEYSANGKKHIYRDSNWENVLIETGLLSNSVKFPQTKF